MFVSRVKAKGNTYIYAYIYDNTSFNRMRTVYSFGKKEKALKKLESWKDISKIPDELVRFGFNTRMLSEWKKKIENL